MPQPMTTVYALLAGVLMAIFQLLRPWDDVDEVPAEMAEAFADPRWLIAHLAGAASFVALALLAREVARAARESDGGRSRLAGLAVGATTVGAALVLPYYGAETFALHEIGRAALAGAPVDVFALSGNIRMNFAAVVMFGVGLLLIAVGGICLSLVAARIGAPAWGAWPLGLLVALALPQFALPPVGRMAYGIIFLIAALLFAVASRRRSTAASVTG